MKRILFLGGSKMQLPAIQYAKEQGYYTILCDYLIDNPGKYYADEYHCVSTTDSDAILEIAKKANIHGIVAYATDSASPTAAYVGNLLNLPSNPYMSVQILTRKDLFRRFLQENNFNCPRAESFRIIEEAKKSLYKFQFPIIVKPTDSTGSRGISRLDSVGNFEMAFEHAITNSREKIVIIEEFIEMGNDPQIGGDIFVKDGKIEFSGLLNCHRNNQVNPYIPVGKSYPLFINEEQIDVVRSELQKVIDLLKITFGAFNIEVIFDKEGKPFIIEMAPRNGGNMIPALLEMITGVNLVEATVEAALGQFKNYHYEHKEAFYSNYILHSGENGKLNDIVFKNGIEKNIVDKVIYPQKGTDVEFFNGANKALGFIFFKFDSLEELKEKMGNINQYIQIELNTKLTGRPL